MIFLKSAILIVDFCRIIIKQIKKGDIMTTYNGSSIFAGITAGLNSTYSVLANASASGVTQSSIAAAQTNTSLTSSLNQTFASYIQSNFSSLDTDKNGTLSSAELSQMTSQISTQGLTQAQLTQLGTATGMSTDALQKVLEHFTEIDANHDGKVTTAEISAYTLKSAAEKKKSEFANKAATDMSMFYGSEDSGASANTSILASRYMDNDASNGNT